MRSTTSDRTLASLRAATFIASVSASSVLDRSASTRARSSPTIVARPTRADSEKSHNWPPPPPLAATEPFLTLILGVVDESSSSNPSQLRSGPIPMLSGSSPFIFPGTPPPVEVDIRQGTATTVWCRRTFVANPRVSLLGVARMFMLNARGLMLYFGYNLVGSVSALCRVCEKTSEQIFGVGLDACVYMFHNGHRGISHSRSNTRRADGQLTHCTLRYIKINQPLGIALRIAAISVTSASTCDCIATICVRSRWVAAKHAVNSCL